MSEPKHVYLSAHTNITSSVSAKVSVHKTIALKAINVLKCATFSSSNSALSTSINTLLESLPNENVTLCDSEYFEKLQDSLNTIDWSSLIHESECSDDYVTIDKAAINEWNIPETIAIPLGNTRVRMKTADFIALISLLVSIIIGIASFVSDRPDSTSNDQSMQQLIEVEQERNQILQEQNNLLESIDASISSRDEMIDSIKSSIQVLYPEIFTQEKPFLPDMYKYLPVPDSVLPTEDSDSDSHSMTPDKTSEYLNTESEN